MKKKVLSSFLFFIGIVLFAQDASLVDFALVFEKQEEVAPLGTLPPGTLVHLRSTNLSWAQIQGQGLTGWIKAPFITIPSDWKITQAQPLVLCPRIILDSTPIALWVYKNQLWWFDLHHRKVIKKENFDTISSIYGLYRDRWLLFEKLYTDGEKIPPLFMKEVWLYDIQTKKKTKLGIFDTKNLSFEDFFVSPDHRYGFVRINVKNRSYTYLWDLVHLRWVGWTTNIQQARFLSNTHIIFRSEKRLFTSTISNLFQVTSNKKITPIPLPPGVQQINSYRLDKNKLYILVDKKIYEGDIAGSNWRLTDFRSFEWNTDQTLNMYVDANGGHLYDVRQKKLVKGFSGENPEKEFIAFTLDGLLIQQHFAKIPTLFLLSSDFREVYRYKAVDKIHATDGNGTLVELVNEGGELILIVERPNKGYYFIFPRKL